jgi:RNA polymerase sigma factor (sigma-70 family)
MTTPDPGTEMAPADVSCAGSLALELHGSRVQRPVAGHPDASSGVAAAGAAPAAESAPAAMAGWEAVYRDHVTAVHRFAAARTGNRPDAEDITTQVFLRALPRLRPEAAPGEVRGYLLATARSVLAEHWSSRFGAPVEPLDEGREAHALAGHAEPDGDEPAGDRGAGRVAAILDRLPDNYRRVLELRFLNGCSVRETADSLGVTVANAKVLQFRALRRAQQLEGETA